MYKWFSLKYLFLTQFYTFGFMHINTTFCNLSVIINIIHFPSTYILNESYLLNLYYL